MSLERLQKLNEDLKKQVALKKQRDIDALAEKEEEREEEEATKLAMAMAMNERLIAEVQEMTGVLKTSIGEIKMTAPDVHVNVPDVVVPEVKLPTFKVPKADKVVVPEIKIPKITVPKPEVTVNVPAFPKIPTPQVNMDFPDTFDVGLDRFTRKTPMPTILVDAAGKPISQGAGGGGKSGITPNQMKEVLNESIPQPQLTAFGEAAIAQNTPQVQLRFPYNVVPPDIGQILVNNANSTVTVTNAQANVVCAGTYPAFSQIRTLDTIRYGPGQGAEFLGTCAFTEGVALSSQVFGPGDDDEGLYFGYNGTSFGVMRRAYGSLEIKSLTITAGADGSGGTFTITIDDTPVVITVAASDTIAEVCAAIVAEADAFGNAGRGWEVHTDDNVSVEFISLVAENASGTFSFSDTGSSGVTATGGFSTEVTGVAPTETWVEQASWNRDPMDGTGPSGMTLDPTKGNVYKIQFQYLGYGAQEFSIENDTTGEFELVHTMHYANDNTIPWCLDPTFHINLIAKTESGYTGGALTMKTASLGGFIQGKENPDGVRRSAIAAKTATATEQVMLIIHSELDFNGRKNKITTYPDFLNFTNEGSKELIIRLKKNPTSITGATTLTDVQTGVSVMQYSTTGTIVVGGATLLTFVIPPGGSDKVDLSALRAKIRPGERYVFTQDGITGGLGDNLLGISWVERI